MIVFNEGVPRAGKSYDCVKNHILPAIKSGRRVFARLNGLDHDAIADHLDMQAVDVRRLLVHVDSAAVLETFRATKNCDGEWIIADELKNALCVIDEVHQFFKQGRMPLSDEHEEFFALIGQNGGDVVIMTQWIKRTHSAVRARIERKNTFQKLSAVGMDGKYRVTYYQTIAPDKYEKIGGTTESYDAKIYPLYHGYAPGSTNTEVYKAGGSSVWKQLAPRFIVAGVAVCVAVWFISGFFSGDQSLIADGKQALRGQPSIGEVYQPSSVPGQVQTMQQGAQQVRESIDQKKRRERQEVLDQLTPQQRFVVSLSDKGRVRLAVRASAEGVEHIFVEWIGTDGSAVERLSGDALRDLGFAVTMHAYGALLTAGKEAIVATSWPLNMVVRESEQRLYNLSGNSSSGAAAGPSEERATTSHSTATWAQGNSSSNAPDTPSYTFGTVSEM